jgi:subtilisin family serine protease
VPGGYAGSCGTSMAAPHVSGVAALLASTHPDATPKQLAKLLADEADPVACPADYDLNDTGTQDAYCTGDTTYNSFYGHGMVNALAAVSGGSANAGGKPNAVTTTVQASPPPVPSQQAATGPVDQPAATPHKSDSANASGPAVSAPGTKATQQPTPTLTPAGGPIGGFALLGMW